MKYKQGMKEIMEAAAALRKAKKVLQNTVNKALPVGTNFTARRSHKSRSFLFEVTREASTDGSINAVNVETGKTWWNVNPSHEWTHFAIVEAERVRK